MTLVVNLFAGPGTGKSTNCAALFAKLKTVGINAEMAHEYAKDLTWEKRDMAIGYQPYVTAKQMWRVHRLLGQVDVIVTDSPILLSTIYKGDGYTDAFEAYILETFRSWNTFNILLGRNACAHKYNPAGRVQTEDEAIALDARIQTTLHNFAIPYEYVPVLPFGATADVLYDLVKSKL